MPECNLERSQPNLKVAHKGTGRLNKVGDVTTLSPGHAPHNPQPRRSTADEPKVARPRVIEIEETLYSRDAGVDRGAPLASFSSQALVESLDPAHRPFATRLVGLLSKGRLRLPVLPDYAAKALQVANDPESSFADYESTIRPNAVMATKLLRVANSPFYGTSSEIKSIRQAMLQLGTRSLSQMVMQVVVEAHAFDDQSDQAAAAKEQQHALAVAHMTQVVAHEVGLSGPEAFMSGLIHDIGRVVVRTALSATKYGRESSDAETLIDALHPIVGAHAATTWKLPELVREAVLRHHDYTAEPRTSDHRGRSYSMIGNVVAGAELLARELGFAVHDHEPAPSQTLTEDILWRDLAMPPRKVERLMDNAETVASRLRG